MSDSWSVRAAGQRRVSKVVWDANTRVCLLANGLRDRVRFIGGNPATDLT